MSAVVIPSATSSNGLHIPQNGHGQTILTPITPVGHDASCHDSTIHTTHINTFHQNSHDLAMVFSQVPWMRFSIVAQPDLTQLASNETLKGFVHQVTSMTIATVSKQIHEEITEAVNQVIKNIAGSVNERMTKVHAGIMQEIVSVTAQKTATDYERLGFPPFDQLLKDLTGDKKHDCHCPPATKPAVPSVPVTVAKPIVDMKPTTITAPEVTPVLNKPVLAPAPSKPLVPSPPSLKGSSWIWTSEYKTNPKPVLGHTRAFRRTILTPSPVNALTLDVSADDMYTVYVNGKLVGSGSNWAEPDRYTVRFEATSRVVIAVVASQGNPLRDVGMIAAGKLWNTADANPAAFEFGTDTKWVSLASEGAYDKFFEPSFVDSTWTPAHVIAPHGGGPWATIKESIVGKAAGQRIYGITKIPNAPIAPVAEEWKL